MQARAGARLSGKVCPKLLVLLGGYWENRSHGCGHNVAIKIGRVVIADEGGAARVHSPFEPCRARPLLSLSLSLSLSAPHLPMCTMSNLSLTFRQRRRIQAHAPRRAATPRMRFRNSYNRGHEKKNVCPPAPGMCHTQTHEVHKVWRCVRASVRVKKRT